MNIIRVDGRFRLQEKLGDGSYDVINNKEVAIKLEPCNRCPSSLEHEFSVLKKLEGGVGFPQPIWFGRESAYYALVLDNLGASLHNILASQGHQFSLCDILTLGNQLISRLEFMHSRNYIHRDIKPTNILIGHGDFKNTTFLIDFGISKEFRDSATRAHIPFHQNHSFVGTPAFTSINHHLGFESGRRDDIESLAYTLIYLLCGSLPWFNKDTPSLSNDAILKLKQDIPAEILCCGIPLEFATLLTYSRSVKFAQKPDYNYLHALLQNYDIIDWAVQRRRWVTVTSNCRVKNTRSLSERCIGRRAAGASSRGASRNLSLQLDRQYPSTCKINSRHWLHQAKTRFLSLFKGVPLV
ncbi:kinase-like protein [Hygrophoropsis aurantiaca]|uniref:Kinase-like protein n=1 Tax=Hygrophoropsis aurantiaca TaxID=72124 RepID=A0ACB7ZXN7_9AGAM|nr:kinase-like protein [Hygrophoropsis aurantiaca]